MRAMAAAMFILGRKLRPSFWKRVMPEGCSGRDFQIFYFLCCDRCCDGCCGCYGSAWSVICVLVLLCCQKNNIVGYNRDWASQHSFDTWLKVKKVSVVSNYRVFSTIYQQDRYFMTYCQHVTNISNKGFCVLQNNSKALEKCQSYKSNVTCMTNEDLV